MDKIINHSDCRVRLLAPQQVRALQSWEESFKLQAKDHRYYELLDQTLEGFEFHYLLIEDRNPQRSWIQPVFFVDQDLVATAPRFLRTIVGYVRKIFPRFLQLKMLMAGCAAGEAHPSSAREDFRRAVEVAAQVLPEIARKSGAWMVIWKDWPAEYREDCAVLTLGNQFYRLASMPATRLALDFKSFDEYMQRQLSHAMRKNLRRKFKATQGDALEMTVVTNVADIVDEVHALYSQVLARSPLQFERLTKKFLIELGTRMPDRARFFLWRHNGRLVACSICLVHDGTIYDEYLGLDYAVALEMHLYFVTLRDVLTWAMANGLKRYRSSPLNYDPKLHLGFELAPLDLYVAGASPLIHGLLRCALPWIAPTRSQPVLKKFPNAADL